MSSVRIPLVCAEGVPSGGLVWNLGVNDTTVLLVVGMMLSVGLEQRAAVCGCEPEE